jgi:beta-N-acetylhexosaminidase
MISILLGRIPLCTCLFLSFCALVLMGNERAQARNGLPADQLRSRVGQMIITGFSGSNATSPDFRRVLKNLQNGVIGGVLFLPANIESRENLQTMIKMVRACKCLAAPLIAVDEEGGIVERLGEDIGFDQTPSAAEIAHDGLSSAKVEYKRVARKLFDLGFNFNLAPVVDLNTNLSNPIIGSLDRSFSENPKVVTKFARIFIIQHHALGILTSLKHFPGHGSSDIDTHIGVADVNTTWREAELSPYRSLIRSHLVDAIMIGHLRNVPRWGGVASQEGFAIKGLLRRQLKFTGVAISDDLYMEGARSTKGSMSDVIASAISTGVDIVLIAQPIRACLQLSSMIAEAS